MIEIENYNKYNKYYGIMLFTDNFDTDYFNIIYIYVPFPSLPPNIKILTFISQSVSINSISVMDDITLDIKIIRFMAWYIGWVLKRPLRAATWVPALRDAKVAESQETTRGRQIRYIASKHTQTITIHKIVKGSGIKDWNQHLHSH